MGWVIGSNSYPTYQGSSRAAELSLSAKDMGVWRVDATSFTPYKTHAAGELTLSAKEIGVWYTHLRPYPHKIPVQNGDDWVYDVPSWYFSDGYRVCKIPLLSSGDLAIETHDGTKYIQFSTSWSKLQVYYNNMINYISYT